MNNLTEAEIKQRFERVFGPRHASPAAIAAIKLVVALPRAERAQAISTMTSFAMDFDANEVGDEPR